MKKSLNNYQTPNYKMKNNPFPESPQISPRQVMLNIANRAKARIQTGYYDPIEEQARARKQLSDYARKTTREAFYGVTHNSTAGLEMSQARVERERLNELMRGGNYTLMESGIRRAMHRGYNNTRME